MNDLIAFEAARLSSWGMGLLLVYLAFARGWNQWHWRLAGTRVAGFVVPEPSVRYDPPRTTGGNPTTFFAAVLGLVPLLAFTPAIAAQHVAWLNIGSSPLMALASVWCLIALIAFLLWKLAFRPWRKLGLSLGWVALSHSIAWLSHHGIV